MKILVTGGAGFIASNIVDAYVDLGHKIVIIDDLSSGRKEFINKKARFYKADIRNRKDISQIIKKETPDIINHHAAQISVRESVADPINDAKINLLGILNLLEEGKNNGLKKFVFASSGGVVYGDAQKIPTSEDYDPKMPLSPYGVAKLTSEFYLNFYYKTYNIPYIALRYSNVYGPRQNPHGEAGVVAIFCKKLLNGETPVINGQGLQTRDYINVRDVVQANINALESNFVGGVNIGTGIETNVKEIYSGIENIVKSGLKAKFGPAKRGEQKRSSLNIKFAKKVLNWQPRVKLAEGLSQTVNFFRSNQ